MELGQFILIVKKRKKILFFAVLLFLAAAAVITFRSSLDYRAGGRLLVVQNYGNNTPLDPYVVAQANKYLTGVLVQVVSSNAFFEQVMAGGFNFDKTYFDGDQAARSAKWQRTVEAFAVEDSGIIDVRAYHPDRYQAEQIAQAVIYALKENHALYHSSGNKVSLKVLDQPLVSNYPVRPDLFLTFGSALLLGFAFGLFYIYIFSYPLEKYLSPSQYRRDYESTKNLIPIEPFEAELDYRFTPPAKPLAAADLPPARHELVYRADQPRHDQQTPQFYREEQPPAPGLEQAIGRGDMRNVLGHKGL